MNAWMLFVLLQWVKCIIDVQDLMTGSVIVENFSEIFEGFA